MIMIIMIMIIYIIIYYLINDNNANLMALLISPEKLWSANICTLLALQLFISDNNSSTVYCSSLSAYKTIKH